jgi:hypothetical protein
MILASDVKIIQSEHEVFNPLNSYFLSTVQSQRTAFKMDTTVLRACKYLVQDYWNSHHVMVNVHFVLNF